MSVPSCGQIIFDSDNLLDLNDLQDVSQTPPVDINGATVTAILTDEADDSVLAISPLTLSEYPGSPSNDYRASFFADTTNGFYVGQRVKINVEADAGVGLRREFNFVAIVCE